MLRGKRWTVLVAALAGPVLAGCAETTLAVHTAKQVSRSEAPARPPGIYKVGEPYQINGVWYYPAEDYGYAETGIASFYGGEGRGVNFHGRTTANGETYDMNAMTAAHQTLPMPSLVRVTNLENGRAVTLRVNDRGPFVRGRIIDVSRRAAQLLGFEAQGTARVRVEILAQESHALKLAMLGQQGGPEIQTVAAAPRGTIASDTLPPPAGARAASSIASASLPPPSATMPPAAAGPVRRGVPQPTMARPAAPVVAEPAPAVPAGAPPAAARGEAQVAALQAPPAPAVTQGPVRPSAIFVQAGAFANYDNAYRLSARLSRYGKTSVTPIHSGGQQLYRVRVGPIGTVQDADSVLAEVGAVVPEARIVVD